MCVQFECGLTSSPRDTVLFAVLVLLVLLVALGLEVVLRLNFIFPRFFRGLSIMPMVFKALSPEVSSIYSGCS